MKIQLNISELPPVKADQMSGLLGGSNMVEKIESDARDSCDSTKSANLWNETNIDSTRRQKLLPIPNSRTSENWLDRLLGNESRNMDYQVVTQQPITFQNSEKNRMPLMIG